MKWSEAAAGGVMMKEGARDAGGLWKLKKIRGWVFPLGSPGGTSPANTLIKSSESDFRFLTCRTKRE